MLLLLLLLTAMITTLMMLLLLQEEEDEAAAAAAVAAAELRRQHAQRISNRLTTFSRDDSIESLEETARTIEAIATNQQVGLPHTPSTSPPPPPPPTHRISGTASHNDSKVNNNSGNSSSTQSNNNDNSSSSNNNSSCSRSDMETTADRARCVAATVALEYQEHQVVSEEVRQCQQELKHLTTLGQGLTASSPTPTPAAVFCRGVVSPSELRRRREAFDTSHRARSRFRRRFFLRDSRPSGINTAATTNNNHKSSSNSKKNINSDAVRIGGIDYVHHPITGKRVPRTCATRSRNSTATRLTTNSLQETVTTTTTTAQHNKQTLQRSRRESAATRQRGIVLLKEMEAQVDAILERTRAEMTMQCATALSAIDITNQRLEQNQRLHVSVASAYGAAEEAIDELQQEQRNMTTQMFGDCAASATSSCTR